MSEVTTKRLMDIFETHHPDVVFNIDRSAEAPVGHYIVTCESEVGGVPVQLVATMFDRGGFRVCQKLGFMYLPQKPARLKMSSR